MQHAFSASRSVPSTTTLAMCACHQRASSNRDRRCWCREKIDLNDIVETSQLEYFTCTEAQRGIYVPGIREDDSMTIAGSRSTPRLGEFRKAGKHSNCQHRERLRALPEHLLHTGDPPWSGGPDGKFSQLFGLQSHGLKEEKR